VYALYYFPGNASLLPHMMLREIGAPFELRLVDRAQNAQKSAEYLRLNPNGRIPVLIDGDFVLYETAAVALHLCDRHPEAALAPPPGTRERSLFYRWLVHLTNTPQAEYRAWFYPHEFVTDEAAAPAVKDAAERRLNGIFDRIADQLGSGPWLLRQTFSAADLYLFMLIRWGRAMPRPPRRLAPLGALAERVLARPAVQAALAAEGLQPPFV
jgi:glutathione S-transferase